jgi:hypothetical protein
MENIIEPNETFDFSKLSLAHPVGIQGGAYFTKIENNKKPLYIQTTKSVTRQGFVKTGKKYYCDLMFDKNAEVIINWFENLEERCQKLIYEKKDSWFQNSLEENDIETAFNSVLRVYKSGKYYLVRTNVRNNASHIPLIKIYDEQEKILPMEDITNETNIISILEIQGIKFTSRSFQIEIEVKQVMALNNEPIFDSCLIKTNTNKITETSKIDENVVDSANKKESLEDFELLNEYKQNNNSNDFMKTNENDITDTNENDITDTNENDNILEEELEPIDILDTPNKTLDSIALDIDFEDLNEVDEEEAITDLKEFNIDTPLENNLETINLKKPNQVYFELYKEARNKAKIAKKNAIIAYLEAKNIKKVYLIENINDSDSDFDAEIDEVSESELEGL